jgi:DNA-directed RNA polymerase subunit E'/Rpb7
MEHVALFEERVALTPRDMRAKIMSIDKIILDKLSLRLENKCSRHGFVVSDTLKILSRSMGYAEKGRFTGDLVFHLQAEGKVLNPPSGFVVEGVVIRKNKMGMYVSYEDAIRIILPRDLHIGDEEFEAIEVGDQVRVEIQKSRFQVNDPYILSVGLFRGKGAAAVAAPVAAAVAAPVAAAEAAEPVAAAEAAEPAAAEPATANENLLILEGGKKKRARKVTPS